MELSKISPLPVDTVVVSPKSKGVSDEIKQGQNHS
jgi:hypothetical protein